MEEVLCYIGSNLILAGFCNVSEVPTRILVGYDPEWKESLFNENILALPFYGSAPDLWLRNIESLLKHKNVWTPGNFEKILPKSGGGAAPLHLRAGNWDTKL